MANRIELSELETYLYHSADILRTHVDASDYKMYVFPLLFFKRICDVYDEETEKKKAELCSPFTGVTSDSWDTPAGHRVYDACRGFSVSWGSGASSASSTSC